MTKRPYFALKLPLQELCKRHGKRMPKVDNLQRISKNFPYRFYREDFSALIGPNAGPFTDSMALTIQSYLGLDPYGTDAINFTPETPPHLLVKQDLFHQGWDVIINTLCRSLRIDERSYLTSEEQVRKAASDVEIAFGWQLETEESPDSACLDPVYLRRKGKIDYPPHDTDYAERLIRWWKCNPNIVFSAYTPRNRVGVTSILPVSRECFEKLQLGEIGVADIRAADIRNKSTYFFIEAGSDRPLIKEDQKTKTRAVLSCILAQLALGVVPGTETTLHGLSFAPCKTGEKRLSQCGYKFIPGRRLKGTSFPLMEFDSSGIDGIRMATGIRMARLVLDRPRKSNASNK